jgi:hypothetical protein
MSSLPTTTYLLFTKITYLSTYIYLFTYYLPIYLFIYLHTIYLHIVYISKYVRFKIGR